MIEVVQDGADARDAEEILPISTYSRRMLVDCSIIPPVRADFLCAER
jgi:hypothetical protein